MLVKVDNANPVHPDLGAVAQPGPRPAPQLPNAFPRSSRLGKIAKPLNEQV
jgi:hypothetical protein